MTINTSITGKGIITLETEGLPPLEVERLRAILHTIISQGVLGVKNTYMTLHFDSDGLVATVETLRRWRAKDGLKTPL